MLREDPLIKLFRLSQNSCYMYDACKNAIIPIARHNYEILEQIVLSKQSFWRQIDRIFDEEFQAFVSSIQYKGYLQPNPTRSVYHPLTNYLEDILADGIESINLQVTQNCNLCCPYCPYSGIYYTNRNHSEKYMTETMAFEGIDFLYRHSMSSSIINVSFYGGEPFLKFPLIKRCVSYAQKRFHNRELVFSVTTNATLLTDEIVRFLHKYNVLLTISLDGPKVVHDEYRKFRNGRGSFEVVYHKIKRIKNLFPEYYKDRVSFNVVLKRKDSFFATDMFFTNNPLFATNEIAFTFFNDNYVKKEIENIDQKFEEAYEFYRFHLYKKLLANHIERLTRTQLDYIKELQNTLADLSRQVGLPPQFHPSGPCVPGRKKLFLNVDGKFFPCERVNELSRCACIGDIKNGLDIEKCKSLLNIGKLTENNCRKCWAFLYCQGCFIQADDGGVLLESKRLQACKHYKRLILEKFKDICMLQEYGVDLSHISVS